MKLHPKVLFGVIFIIFLVIKSSGIPGNINTVSSFNIWKFLGKWYEIARMEQFYEKNLSNTSIECLINENGTILIYNSGYNNISKKWVKAVGKVRLKSIQTEASFEICYYNIFNSRYSIIGIDEDYQYALIMGSDIKKAWIISRSISLPENIKSDFLELANSFGIDISSFIWVVHDLPYE